MHEPAMQLPDLLPDTVGVIEAVHAHQDMRRRLAALGLRNGIRVQVIRRSPLNGPLQVRVGHTDLILRRADAANIQVRAA